MLQGSSHARTVFFVALRGGCARVFFDYFFFFDFGENKQSMNNHTQLTND